MNSQRPIISAKTMSGATTCATRWPEILRLARAMSASAWRDDRSAALGAGRVLVIGPRSREVSATACSASDGASRRSRKVCTQAGRDLAGHAGKLGVEAQLGG